MGTFCAGMLCGLVIARGFYRARHVETMRDIIRERGLRDEGPGEEEEIVGLLYPPESAAR